MPIDPKIVDKIRKLLSLGSNNPESNEAAAALKKAAQLAEMYGLALSDVDKESGETKVDRMEAAALQKRYDVWMGPLAVVISKVFNCQVIRSGEQLVFVGTPTDLQLTLWYFKMIRIKIIRQGKEKFKGIKDQQTYGVGALGVLRERLTEMFVKEQEAIRTADTKALVIVKNKEVDRVFEEMFPHRFITRHKPFTGSRAAFLAGEEDGRRMGLHSGEVGRNRKMAIGE